MNVKVWNLEYAPFPREGLNHLLPSPDCPVSQLLRREAGKLARTSQFDLPADAAELRRFQESLRARIRKQAGIDYDPDLPLEVEEHGVIRQPGYTITKLTYQGRPGVHVTALLYRPDGPGSFPAVIHPHGHHVEGKFGDYQQYLSAALARNGYVCLAPDCFGTYERATVYREKEYHGGFLGGALFNIGESLLGAQVTDNMRGVDLLRSLPFVLPDKIGACGASGGGNQTMWLAAMDERIAAAMPVVSVGSFESYVTMVNCVCELLPDGLTFTEEAGVLALIAPRPLRIGNAYYDVNPAFGVGEMLKTYHQVEKLYWQLGKGDCLAYTVADRVHGMSDHQREAVLGWFDCWLKGVGKGRPRPAGAEEMLDNDTLASWPDPQPRPAKVRPIDVHCRLKGEALRQAFLARPFYDGAEKRAELKAILRLPPPPARRKWVDYTVVEGYARFSLETGDHLIPGVIRENGTGEMVLLLHPDGKQALADAEFREGGRVISCDLFGTGETAMPNCIIGEHHQFFRQLLWIGRSLPGEWVYDILELTAALRERFPGVPLRVKARKEAGLCALLAAALAPGCFALELEDAPCSYLFSREAIPSFVMSDPFAKKQPGFYYTDMMPLPGILQWGDLSLAAALTGGEPVIRSPRRYDGQLCTEAEKSALAAEIAAVRAKLK